MTRGKQQERWHIEGITYQPEIVSLEISSLCPWLGGQVIYAGGLVISSDSDIQNDLHPAIVRTY